MSKANSDIAVYNRTRDTFLGTRVRIADSSLRRLVGLLGQPFVAPGSGLLIFPSNSIHTFGMRFAIDVIFLDRKFRVIDLCEMVQPYRLVWPRWKARSVLELPVRTIRESRTEVGDQLEVSADSAAQKVAVDRSDAPSTDAVSASFDQPEGAISKLILVP